MKTRFVFLVLILAALHSVPSFARHVVIHHWKIVDLLQNGTFCFEGDDAKWYYYQLPTSQNAFQPSDQPEIYLLPQGGKWTATNTAPDASTVQEEEKAIVQFDANGYPTDGQAPPPPDNSDNTN